jgi:ABC-type transporter Mla MlaB component
MNITVSQMQGRVPVTVFHIKGDIDANSHQQLQIQAQEAHQTGTHNLLLDLTEVPYISSAGLRALHHIFIMLRTSAPGESDSAMSKGLRDGTFKSPHLKLLNPSPAVFNALSTAGFDMYLEIHRDLKQAVSSF